MEFNNFYLQPGAQYLYDKNGKTVAVKASTAEGQALIQSGGVDVQKNEYGEDWIILGTGFYNFEDDVVDVTQLDFKTLVERFLEGNLTADELVKGLSDGHIGAEILDKKESEDTVCVKFFYQNKTYTLHCAYDQSVRQADDVYTAASAINFSNTNIINIDGIGEGYSTVQASVGSGCYEQFRQEVYRMVENYIPAFFGHTSMGELTPDEWEFVANNPATFHCEPSAARAGYFQRDAYIEMYIYDKSQQNGWLPVSTASDEYVGAVKGYQASLDSSRGNAEYFHQRTIFEKEGWNSTKIKKPPIDCFLIKGEMITYDKTTVDMIYAYLQDTGERSYESGRQKYEAFCNMLGLSDNMTKEDIENALKAFFSSDENGSVGGQYIHVNDMYDLLADAGLVKSYAEMKKDANSRNMEMYRPGMELEREYAQSWTVPGLGDALGNGIGDGPNGSRRTSIPGVYVSTVLKRDERFADTYNLIKEEVYYAYDAITNSFVSSLQDPTKVEELKAAYAQGYNQTSAVVTGGSNVPGNRTNGSRIYERDGKYYVFSGGKFTEVSKPSGQFRLYVTDIMDIGDDMNITYVLCDPDAGTNGLADPWASQGFMYDDEYTDDNGLYLISPTTDPNYQYAPSVETPPADTWTEEQVRALKDEYMQEFLDFWSNQGFTAGWNDACEDAGLQYYNATSPEKAFSLFANGTTVGTTVIKLGEKFENAVKAYILSAVNVIAAKLSGTAGQALANDNFSYWMHFAFGEDGKFFQALFGKSYEEFAASLNRNEDFAKQIMEYATKPEKLSEIINIYYQTMGVRPDGTILLENYYDALGDKGLAQPSYLINGHGYEDHEGAPSEYMDFGGYEPFSGVFSREFFVDKVRLNNVLEQIYADSYFDETGAIQFPSYPGFDYFRERFAQMQGLRNGFNVDDIILAICGSAIFDGQGYHSNDLYNGQAGGVLGNGDVESVIAYVAGIDKKDPPGVRFRKLMCFFEKIGFTSYDFSGRGTVPTYGYVDSVKLLQYLMGENEKGVNYLKSYYDRAVAYDQEYTDIYETRETEQQEHKPIDIINSSAPPVPWEEGTYEATSIEGVYIVNGRIYAWNKLTDEYEPLLPFTPTQGSQTIKYTVEAVEQAFRDKTLYGLMHSSFAQGNSMVNVYDVAWERQNLTFILLCLDLSPTSEEDVFVDKEGNYYRYDRNLSNARGVSYADGNPYLNGEVDPDVYGLDINKLFTKVNRNVPNEGDYDETIETVGQEELNDPMSSEEKIAFKDFVQQVDDCIQQETMDLYLKYFCEGSPYYVFAQEGDTIITSDGHYVTIEGSMEERRQMALDDFIKRGQQIKARHPEIDGLIFNGVGFLFTLKDGGGIYSATPGNGTFLNANSDGPEAKTNELGIKVDSIYINEKTMRICDKFINVGDTITVYNQDPPEEFPVDPDGGEVRKSRWNNILYSTSGNAFVWDAENNRYVIWRGAADSIIRGDFTIPEAYGASDFGTLVLAALYGFNTTSVKGVFEKDGKLYTIDADRWRGDASATSTFKGNDGGTRWHHYADIVFIETEHWTTRGQDHVYGENAPGIYYQNTDTRGLRESDIDALTDEQILEILEKTGYTVSEEDLEVDETMEDLIQQELDKYKDLGLQYDSTTGTYFIMERDSKGNPYKIEYYWNPIKKKFEKIETKIESTRTGIAKYLLQRMFIAARKQNLRYTANPTICKDENGNIWKYNNEKQAFVQVTFDNPDKKTDEEESDKEGSDKTSET